MRKVDRLILIAKAALEEAQRLDDNAFCYALVAPAAYLEESPDSPNYDKWETLVYLNKGTFKSEGFLLDAQYFDTKEEALAAAREIQAIHAPTGNRTPTQDPYIFTINGAHRETE